MSVLAFQMVIGGENEAAQIARALKRRDTSVLDRLIETYQHRLLRYLVSLTGNRSLAEDFFQETWLRVLERGHQYDGRTKFEIWLFAIARHLAIDAFRRIQPVSLDRDQDEAPIILTTAEPSPFEAAASTEAGAHVRAALDTLRPAHREILVLRFQEELRLEEIAVVIGIPLPTVKSRLYRALEALRGSLEGGRYDA
jgi:RNA polymerase sigma-70 factor (ECF subfamily)